MKTILTLALAGFTEARRNRITVIAAVFIFILILSTTIILNLVIFTLDRVAVDFGLGVMSLLLVGLAIFLSSNQLSREIERRTVFLVLSRPVSRAQFVVGRVLGTVLTLWSLLALMSVVFMGQLLLLDVRLTPALFAALIGLAIELVLLSALGALFSSAAGQVVASLATVGTYLIGHGAGDLHLISSRAKYEGARIAGQAIYWVIPQLDRLDYKLHAAHSLTIDWSMVAVSSAYALCYAAVALVIAVAVFQRTDFK